MATLKFADSIDRKNPFELSDKEKQQVDRLSKTLQPLTCDAKGRALQVGNMEIG